MQNGSTNGANGANGTNKGYSSTAEASRIFDFLCGLFDDTDLPSSVRDFKERLSFTATRDQPYFPIPLKETETTAALKAIEGAVACLLADLKTGKDEARHVTVNLEKTTAFLCQAYMAKIAGLGKLDPSVKKLLKG